MPAAPLGALPACCCCPCRCCWLSCPNTCSTDAPPPAPCDLPAAAAAGGPIPMLRTLTGLDLAPGSNLALVSRPTAPSAPGLSDDALNPEPPEPSPLAPLPVVSPDAAAAAAGGTVPGVACGSSRGERSPRGVRETPSTSATLGGRGMLLKRHIPWRRNPGRCCSSCCRGAGSTPCCCCC